VEQTQCKELTNCDNYYAILSKTLFGFLWTQINKYCLGFEHLYTHTAVGVEVEWEKSQLMVYFLWMLRLCYPFAREFWKLRSAKLLSVKPVCGELGPFEISA
jgi:hypothetical protein